MDHTIREKRRIAFEYKKFTSATAVALSGIIEGEVTAAASAGVPYYVAYTLDTQKDIAFESASPAIFTANEVTGNHLIQKIHMRFYTLDNSKSVEVQFTHAISDAKQGNFVMVSGDNSTWVNGILSRLTAVVTGAEDQLRFNTTFRGLVVTALVVAGIVESFRLSSKYMAGFRNELFFSFYIVALAFGCIFLGVRAVGSMDQLWPSVELSSGPEHLNGIVRQRNRLKWILLTIVIPLLLSVIYDIFKAIDW